MKVKLKVYLNLILILLVINPVFGARTKKMERKKFIVIGSLALGAIMTTSLSFVSTYSHNSVKREVIDLNSAFILRVNSIKEAFFSESTKTCSQAMESIMLVSNGIAETELRLEIFKRAEKIQPRVPEAIDYKKVKQILSINSQKDAKLKGENSSAKFVSQYIYKVDQMIAKIKESVKEDTATRQNICFDKIFSKWVKEEKDKAAANIDKIAKELESDFNIFEIFRDKEEYREKWLTSANMSDRATIKQAIKRNDSVWRKANAVLIFLIDVADLSGIKGKLAKLLTEAVEFKLTEEGSLADFVSKTAKMMEEEEFHKILVSVVNSISPNIMKLVKLKSDLTEKIDVFLEVINLSTKVRREEAKLSLRLRETKIQADNVLALKSFQTVNLTYSSVINSQVIQNINESLKKCISAAKIVAEPTKRIKEICLDNTLVCSKVVNTPFVKKLIDKGKKVYPRDILGIQSVKSKIYDENFFAISQTEVGGNALILNYFFSLDDYRIFSAQLREKLIPKLTQEKILDHVEPKNDRERVKKLLRTEILRVSDSYLYVYKLPQSELEKGVVQANKVAKPYDYGLQEGKGSYTEFKSILLEKACKLVTFNLILYSIQEKKNLSKIQFESGKNVTTNSGYLRLKMKELVKIYSQKFTVANYLDVHFVLRNKVPAEMTFTKEGKQTFAKFKFEDAKDDLPLLGRYTTGDKTCEHHKFLNYYPFLEMRLNYSIIRATVAKEEKQVLEDVLSRITHSIPVHNQFTRQFDLNMLISSAMLELDDNNNKFIIGDLNKNDFSKCHYSFQFAEINFKLGKSLNYSYEANSAGFPTLVSKKSTNNQTAFKNKVYVLIYFISDDLKDTEETSGILTTINKKMSSRNWFAVPQEAKIKVKVTEKGLLKLKAGHIHIQTFQHPIENQDKQAAIDICSKR